MARPLRYVGFYRVDTRWNRMTAGTNRSGSAPIAIGRKAKRGLPARMDDLSFIRAEGPAQWPLSNLCRLRSAQRNWLREERLSEHKCLGAGKVRRLRGRSPFSSRSCRANVQLKVTGIATRRRDIDRTCTITRVVAGAASAKSCTNRIKFCGIVTNALRTHKLTHNSGIR
jgi:hypothetical protein